MDSRVSFHGVIVVAAMFGCGASAKPVAAPAQPAQPGPVAAVPAVPPTLVGMVRYDDGAPVSDGVVTIEERDTGSIVAVAATDGEGHYEMTPPSGHYLMTVAAPDGFSWIEQVSVPGVDARTFVTRSCRRLVGQVKGARSDARAELSRDDSGAAYTFIRRVAPDGRFTACLPEGEYSVSVTGQALAAPITVDLDAPMNIELEAFAAIDVKRPPRSAPAPRVDLQGVVDDILAHRPAVIGLGEATHGTGDFYSARGELTFALIKQARARLLLFEFDAIASVALDNYINGGDVDLAKALPALRFWITDVYEFRRVLEQLRAYNATAADKVHLWGIDLQNTTLPIDVLIANASELGITPSQQAVLGRLTKRGRDVRALSGTEQADLDALLARIAAARGHDQHALLEVVAARSLALQLEYWDGDEATWYDQRRDRGMAELARLIVEQTGSPRAVVWAHDGHIAKAPQTASLGHYLSELPGGYYAVGYYIYQGSARAWDPHGEIGVIPHPVAPAPDYTVEGAMMHAAGQPAFAWLALGRLPPVLSTWLAVPRFVREMGHTYQGEAAMLTLYDVRQSFDAVVVIRTGHDSSPTPTGVRTATHN